MNNDDLKEYVNNYLTSNEGIKLKNDGNILQISINLSEGIIKKLIMRENEKNKYRKKLQQNFLDVLTKHEVK